MIYLTVWNFQKTCLKCWRLKANWILLRFQSPWFRKSSFAKWKRPGVPWTCRTEPDRTQALQMGQICRRKQETGNPFPFLLQIGSCDVMRSGLGVWCASRVLVVIFVHRFEIIIVKVEQQGIQRPFIFCVWAAMPWYLFDTDMLDCGYIHIYIYILNRAVLIWQNISIKPVCLGGDVQISSVFFVEITLFCMPGEFELPGLLWHHWDSRFECGLSFWLPLNQNLLPNKRGVHHFGRVPAVAEMSTAKSLPTSWFPRLLIPSLTIPWIRRRKIPVNQVFG